MDMVRSRSGGPGPGGGTQTDVSFWASAPRGSSRDNVSPNECRSPLVAGDATNRDREKQEPRDYDKDTFLVHWSGPNDKENPRNFSYFGKWLITVTLGIMTLTVAIASSIFSTATEAAAKQFHVSGEVMILGTSLFVLGFAFGPLVFGPISELYGRRAPTLTGMLLFSMFQIPVAVTHRVETIFIGRLFGGVFASAPLAISGGMLAKLFEPIDRGIAVAVFSGCILIGPAAGLILGGFITTSFLGWRWTEYITAIMAFLFTRVAVLILPETYEPVLLKWRAQTLRYETRRWAIHAKTEENPANIKTIAKKYLLRPFQMLVLEPILLLVTLYMSFIYGFLNLSFVAYPIAFQELRGWNRGVGALPFIAVVMGVMAGCAFAIVFSRTRFQKRAEKLGHIAPEERLIPMTVGGILLAAGMFWFAWTSSPHILWVPQMISGVFLGAGILLIFMQGLNYIIDVYAMHANSALAANSLFRWWLGAGSPLFAVHMIHNVGVDWAMTLLGFLTSALFPVPILFYIYGKRIRQWSRYTAR